MKDLQEIFDEIRRAVAEAQERGACVGCGSRPEVVVLRVERQSFDPKQPFGAQVSYDHTDWCEVRSNRRIEAMHPFAGILVATPAYVEEMRRSFCPECSRARGIDIHLRGPK